MISKRRLKRHFNFSGQEIKDFNITTVLLSITIFFFIWAFHDLNIITGIFTYIYSFLITAISLFAFISVPKLIAIQRGFTCTYSGWVTGQLVAFVIAFISYGIFPIILPGLITIKSIERIRHGEIFAYENKKDIRRVLIMAPITSIILVIIATPFFLATNSDLIYYFMATNVLLAAYSMLPFTKSIGSHLFYIDKFNYIPRAITIIVFALFVLFKFKYAILTLPIGLLIGNILNNKVKNTALFIKKKKK